MAQTTNLATGGGRIGRPKLKEIGGILFNGIQQKLPLMTGYLMFALQKKHTFMTDFSTSYVIDYQRGLPFTPKKLHWLQ